MKTLIAAILSFGILGAVTPANSDTLINELEWEIDKSHEGLYCLAQNIYFEAQSEPLAGQFAVADVVLNRVRDERWPESICGVIKQSKISQWHLNNTGKRVPVLNQCSFSWFCDGKSDVPKNREAWKTAQTVAIQIIQSKTFRGITEGATHYHATYVKPSWTLSFQYVGQIGKHLFYRDD